MPLASAGRAALAERARRTAERFSMEAMVEAVERVYREVVETIPGL